MVAHGRLLQMVECLIHKAFLYIKKGVHLFIFTSFYGKACITWERVHYMGKHALHWKECITFKGMQYSLCNLQKLTLGNQAWCFYVCDLSLFGCQTVYANAFVILFHSFATVVVVVDML